MISKKCVKCGFVGDTIDDFYPRNAKCKSCVRLKSRLYYKKKAKDSEWLKKERKRGRIKSRNRVRKKDTPETKKAYLIRYPEKYKAQTAIQHLNKREGFHFHHWSYNDGDLKNVIELTSKHHNKAHRFIIYDPERKMYRSTDGVLLDTREAHEQYIFDKIKTEID